MAYLMCLVSPRHDLDCVLRSVYVGSCSAPADRADRRCGRRKRKVQLDFDDQVSIAVRLLSVRQSRRARSG